MGQGGLGGADGGGFAASAQACADRQSSLSSASGEQQLQPRCLAHSTVLHALLS